MKPMELKPGDVVQISPAAENEVFRGCLVIVSEPKSFGCQGYVQVPGKGQAYCRPKFEDIEYVGIAWWVAGSAADSFEKPSPAVQTEGKLAE